MFLELFAVLCLFIVWIVLVEIKSKDDIPVMSGRIPLIGHAHLFLGVNIWRCATQIAEECMKKGGVMKLNLGTRNMYTICDPDDAKKVLDSCLQKDSIYRFGKPFLGNGLVTGDVSTWKVHRRLLNPSFNVHVINSFIGIFNSQSQRLTDILASEVGKELNIEKLLRFNNLETICMTATDSSIQPKNDTIKEQYLKCLTEFNKLITTRFQKFWYHSDLIYSFSKLKKKQDEIVDKLLGLSRLIVQKNKVELRKASTIGTKNLPAVKPFLTLLQELADSTGCFTDEEVREETDNIIVGGHDTSASVLTYAFLLLGSYPDVQEKVYDEITQVVGHSKRCVDKDDIPNLVYIEAVLKETMRLYPVVPIIARHIDKEVQLKNYTLKPDTGCVIFIMGIHRCSKWGPDADHFRPERWLEPTTANLFAFSMGKRSCIGKMYAMMSMKTVIAHVVRQYRIRADISKLKLKLDVLLRPEEGQHVILELR